MSEERWRYDTKLVGPPGPHELLAMVPRLRAVLAAVEWSADGARCPICHGRERHEASCEEAALLDELGAG